MFQGFRGHLLAKELVDAPLLRVHLRWANALHDGRVVGCGVQGLRGGTPHIERPVI